MRVIHTSLFLILVAAVGGQSSAQILNYPAGSTGAESQSAAPPQEEESWGWFPKPQITMPKITMPKISFPSFNASSMAKTAFAPMKASAAKISAGTKKAWEGTKELFNFTSGSEDTSPRVASRNEPSTWQRVFGAAPQDTGPQTIGEFMSGTRPQ